MSGNGAGTGAGLKKNSQSMACVPSLRAPGPLLSLVFFFCWGTAKNDSWSVWLANHRPPKGHRKARPGRHPQRPAPRASRTCPTRSFAFSPRPAAHTRDGRIDPAGKDTKPQDPMPETKAPWNWAVSELEKRVSLVWQRKTAIF